jgi:hypothetical protein
MFGKKEDFLGLRVLDGKDSPVKLESRAVFLFGRGLGPVVCINRAFLNVSVH